MAVAPNQVRTDRWRGDRDTPLRRPLDAVYGLVRWVGGHVRNFYAAVGLFLLIGLAVSMAALALFALVARGMTGGATQAFDEWAVGWARQQATGWLDGLALLGAVLGSGAATYTVLALGTIVFWRTRHHYSAALLWTALVGGRVLNEELKALFGRPRPMIARGDMDLLGVTVPFPSSASFPSGHAITSVIIFGTLAYFAVRMEASLSLRRWTLAVALTAILLIGLSRIYLGVHYPSDVLAGYLAGFIWASVCAMTIEAIRIFRTKRRARLTGEKDLELGIRPLREAIEGERAR